VKKISNNTNLKTYLKKLRRDPPFILYQLDWLYQVSRFHYWSSIKKRPPILIYQMGKVGSRTIADSLKQRHLDMPVYHFHYLTNEAIEMLKQSRNNRVVWLITRLRRQIDNNSAKNKYKLISLTRDPVARNMSSFFYNIHYRFKDFSQRYMDGRITLDELEGMFINNYEYQHQLSLNWFETELKKVFGIDVYASAFPKEKGYKIYIGDTADLLVLKLEMLKSCATPALKEFLGLDNFTPATTNTSNTESYYKAYKDFMDKKKLPDTYIERMYSSKYARHFYTDAEIQSFIERWSKRELARR